MTVPPSSPSDDGDQSPNAQVSTVTVDGDRRLAYAEYGDPDGTPVVFLHGAPGSHRLGSLFDSAAREREVRLLALDRPGYGRSSPWPTRTVSDAGTFVGAVLDDAGVESAGLVAFSGGSPHALATAVTHPDRVNRVDSVAGATPPSVTDEVPTVQRVLSGLATTTPTLLRGLFRGQAFLAKRLDPSFVVTQYTADGGGEAIPDAVAEVVRDDFVEAFTRTRSGAVTEFRITATDWGIDFDEVDVDVALWHGDADTNIPIAGVRRLRERLPTVELRVIDGADHLRTLLRCGEDVLEAQC